MTREEFITASEVAFERLISPLKDLPEDLMDEPIADGAWSVKQIILHLIYWDMLVVKALEALYQNIEFDWTPYGNTDELNKQIVSGKQDDLYARIETEFQIVHSALMAAIERIPIEHFGENGELPDWLLTHVPEHYNLHVPKVEAWAKKIRDEGRGGKTGLPVIE